MKTFMKTSSPGRAAELGVCGLVALAFAACATNAPPSAQASQAPPTAALTATGAAPAAPDACSQLAGACHVLDHKGGSPLVHECHHLGHAHEVEACVARRDECLAACAGHGD